MRLRSITEGMVSSAKGDIINVKNGTASEIADAIERMNYPDPDVEFASTSSDNASIYIEVGNNRAIPQSQVVMVQVVADDDIYIRIPTLLSELINGHDYYKLSSIDEAILALQKIMSKMLEHLSGRY